MNYTIKINTTKWALVTLHAGQWNAASAVIPRGRTYCMHGESVRRWVARDVLALPKRVIEQREEPWGKVITIEEAIRL